MNSKNTKRALLSSVLALVLCVSMLVGSTFAWFTDSVSTGVNTIQSGTLDLALYMKDASGNWVNAEGSTLSWITTDSVANVLWEPGCTYKLPELKIVNEGNLHLKYEVAITGLSGDAKLLEVIDFTYTGIEKGQLAPNGEQVFTIEGHMKEEAGNEYQGLTTGDISITVYATQASVENDSFGPNYDAQTDRMGTASAVIPTGDSYLELMVEDSEPQAYNVAWMRVPVAAIEDPDLPVDVVVAPAESATTNIAVAADETIKGFEVTATNIKAGNTEEILVKLRIPAGLDPQTIKLYHYDEDKTSEYRAVYDPADGYVSFYTTSFSPFAVVYDADSEYVAPDAEGAPVPVANVVTFSEADLRAKTPGYGEYKDEEGNEIAWLGYGQFSPDYEADANPKLETAYTFSCVDDLAAAQASAYANWKCDFYVSLDRDLGENQIFLGGNYAGFGWIGFHNREVTLSAGEELGLMEAALGSLTYMDVVQSVREFHCGVGDVNDALTGATFTVELRLTNPDDANDTRTVETIRYTFD